MRVRNLPDSTPALADYIVGSDTSDNNKTVKFTVEDLVGLVDGATGATSLDELTDVSVSGGDSPTDAQALLYDAGTATWKPGDVASGGGGGSIESLQDITDVDNTSPQNGEVLQWDSATESWVPSSIPAFTPVELDELTDVDVSTVPDPGEFLLYNSGSSSFVPVQYRHVIKFSVLDRGELISAAFAGSGDQLLVGDAFIVPSYLNGYEVEGIAGSFNASAASEGVLIGLAINGTPVAGSGSELDIPKRVGVSPPSSTSAGLQRNQNNYSAGNLPLATSDLIQLYIDANVSSPGSGTELFVTITLVPDRT
jgi:hypothetical protein